MTRQTLQADALTVLFDESCALCRRARDWLLTQPCLVEVHLLPAGDPAVRARYHRAERWLGKELVVVAGDGRTWVGPAAFLMCMWATARYRGWAYRLARPGLAPLAEGFFRLVSRRRDRIGAWIGKGDPECSWCNDPHPQGRHELVR